MASIDSPRTCRPPHRRSARRPWPRAPPPPVSLSLSSGGGACPARQIRRPRGRLMAAAARRLERRPWSRAAQPPRSPSLSSAAAPAQRARSGGLDLGPWRRRPDPRGSTAVVETRGARRGEAVCGASCRTCRRRSRPVLARRHTGLLRATAAASPSSSAGAVASPRPRRPAEGGDQDPRRRRLRPTPLRHREHPLLRRRRRAWLAADGSKRRGGLLPAPQTGRPSSCSTGLPGKRSSSSATTADLSRTGVFFRVSLPPSGSPSLCPSSQAGKLLFPTTRFYIDCWI